jgi:hypothetical protein
MNFLKQLTAWSLTAACLTAFGAAALPASTTPPVAGPAHPIPRLVQKDGRYALFVDGAPYLILGAQINNSSAWPAMLPKVWPAMAALHVNTVEMPVYWEQMEPQPGHFDFSVVDTLLSQARAHHVHLSLLWFGTWKNGSAHYLPEWMKLQPAKYPNVINSDGAPLDSPSPNAPATLAADIHAFSALMAHLKAADPQRTVILVQVENEPGTWGGIRDYSPMAQALFDGPVPTQLLTALGKPATTEQTWREAFGEDADEFFHAYSIARYIGQVAAAGKAIYPLPMYVNAALRDPITPSKLPSYESGGATDNVLGIWKAAAPAIDLLAPDIYQNDPARYRRVLDLYQRPDNALLIPETGGRPANARYFYTALGHGAIGFAPFGLDATNYAAAPLGAPALSPDTLAAFALDYEAIGPMMREIAALSFAGKVQADAEETNQPKQVFNFDNWEATASYGQNRYGAATTPPVNPNPLGRALVAHLGPNQFLVTGAFCRVTFRPIGPLAGKTWQYLRVEEGQYKNGVFQPIRIWNGDQTDWGLNFSSAPQVLRVSLYTR